MKKKFVRNDYDGFDFSFDKKILFLRKKLTTLQKIITDRSSHIENATQNRFEFSLLDGTEYSHTCKLFDFNLILKLQKKTSCNLL